MNRDSIDIDIRFKLLNRETELVVGLIAGGLSDLKSISKGDCYYYESFYSLSLGIERLLKLLLIVENKELDIKRFRHNIKSLFEYARITFPENSTEELIISFLTKFAEKNRYSIIDCISSGVEDTSFEPIRDFSETIGKDILDRHNFVPYKYLINMDTFPIFFMHIEENFEINQNPEEMLLIFKKKDFIAKYAAMYIGRIIQPILQRLRDLSGNKHKNPYFYEHFPYISGDDNFFKNRKTFRKR